MRRLQLLIIAIVSVSLLKAQESVSLGSVSLDSDFGEEGIVKTYFFDPETTVDDLYSIAVQEDGKIIATGNTRYGATRMAIARYNPDGSLDETFHETGKLAVDVEDGSKATAVSVKVLPNGKVLYGGRLFNTSTYMISGFLMQFNGDGSVDNSFGLNNNGIVTTEYSFDVVVEQMVVQEDGKILLAGYQDGFPMLIRYNADGTLDSGFGNNGFCAFESFEFSLYDVAVGENGKIFACGGFYPGGPVKWGVMCVKPDGTIDNTFGGEGNGIKAMSLGEGLDIARSIALQDDGKIVIAGHSWDQNTPLIYSYAIGRLNQDGSFDESFAENGLARFTQIEETGHYLKDVIVSPNGNIYACGHISIENIQHNLSVIGLDSDGNVLPGFSEAITIDVGFNAEYGEAILLQDDGKLLVAGSTKEPNNSAFLVARYIIPNSGVSVSENKEKETVVYPNPVSEKLYIKKEGVKYFDVEVYDIQGRFVIGKEKTNVLDMSGLNKGVYFVKTEEEGIITTSRVVKN